MEKQKQQEEHLKVRKELRRRINKMIRLTLSDFKVEALEQFDRNFEREAFFNEKWARRKHNDDTSRGLLVDTGALRRSITGHLTSHRSVVIESTVPYARKHNYGFVGVEYVRPFRRKRLNASEVKSRKQIKVGGHNVRGFARKVRFPRRQFIGMHPELEKALRAIFESNVADIASGPDSV